MFRVILAVLGLLDKCGSLRVRRTLDVVVEKVLIYPPARFVMMETRITVWMITGDTKINNYVWCSVIESKLAKLGTENKIYK